MAMTIRSTVCTGIAMTALAGCPSPEAVIPPLTDEIDALSSEGIEATVLSGIGQAEVRLRSVNAVRGSVPSSAVTVEVDGAEESVDLDGRGRGTLVVTGEGSHEVLLPDGSVVVAHVTTGEFAPTGLRRADLAPEASRVIMVEGDRVLMDGRRVWWAPDGEPAEVVLEVGEGEGDANALSGDIDRDGVTDLVVWSERSIHFLRGSGSGRSYAWAGGLRSSSAELEGLAFEDVDKDGSLDMIAAWRLEDQSLVDISRGTGLLNYEAYQRLFLIGQPTGLTIANGRDGVPELTVLTDNGEWERFRQGEDLLFVLVGSDAPAALPDEATISSSGDFHGDGIDDLLLIGPQGVGEVQAQLFDLTQTPPTFIQRAPFDAWIAPGDADGNGNLDLWTVLSDGEVKVLATDRPQPVEWGTGRLPRGGPFAVQEVPGSSASLWALAGDHWQHVVGAEGSGGAIWRIEGALFDNLLVDIDHVWPVDQDGDAIVWVGTEVREGEITVKRWSFTPGAPSVSELGRAVVGPGTVIEDSARCGDELYVLAAAELVKLNIENTPVEVARIPTAASRVACAPDVAATLTGGQVLWYDDTLQDTSAAAAPGAEDLTLVETASGWEQQTCSAPDCRIEWWPDSPGGEGSVVSDADGIRVVEFSGGAATTLWGHGEMMLDDADQDGRLDVVVWREDGVLALHRSTETHVMEPQIWFVPRATGRPGFLADGDQDGSLDLFAIDDEGLLFATVSPPAQ